MAYIRVGTVGNFGATDAVGTVVYDVYGWECGAEELGGGAVGTLHAQFEGIVAGGNVGGYFDVLAQYIVIVR